MIADLVVADSGPLHYLVLIDCAEILSGLFGRVLIPFAVRDELLHPRAPQKVTDWLVQPPAWLEITEMPSLQPVHGLHPGESESLQLALLRGAAAVLMDDMDGRAAARRLGLGLCQHSRQGREKSFCHVDEERRGRSWRGPGFRRGLSNPPTTLSGFAVRCMFGSSNASLWLTSYALDLERALQSVHAAS